MKRILVIDLNNGDQASTVNVLGQQMEIRRVGSGGDPDRIRALIAENDGHVDVIALDGMPATLQLGQHAVGVFVQIDVEFAVKLLFEIADNLRVDIFGPDEQVKLLLLGVKRPNDRHAQENRKCGAAEQSKRHRRE